MTESATVPSYDVKALRQPRFMLLASLLLLLTGCVSATNGVDEAAELKTANDPAALMRIAAAAAASNDVATATAFYGRAAKLTPTDATAALGQARGLVQQGQVEEAISVLQARLSTVDAAGAMQINEVLGKLLIIAHRPAEAAAVFRTALKTTPDKASLLIGLGVALDVSRDFPAAQEAYRRALAIEPSSIAARNDLTLSMALQGHSKQAISGLLDLRKQVTRDGGHDADLATINGNLAIAYALRGDLKHAGEANADASPSPGDLATNMRFYSALAPNGATQTAQTVKKTDSPPAGDASPDR